MHSALVLILVAGLSCSAYAGNQVVVGPSVLAAAPLAYAGNVPFSVAAPVAYASPVHVKTLAAGPVVYSPANVAYAAAPAALRTGNLVGARPAVVLL